MLDSTDYKKIIEILKEYFYTKEEQDKNFDELRQDFRNLQTAVDGYARKADLYYQEMAFMRYRLERMEDWIQQALQKIGVVYRV